MKRTPAYLKLSLDELIERANIAEACLASCTLCAHECSVNRIAGERGTCQTGVRAVVSSYGPHLGEEDPLRGWHGSGTIFFSGCNLSCQFCQNHDISQSAVGREITAKELAGIMVYLQNSGCHNINLVSPSHVVSQVISALVEAIGAGLKIPLVYNTGGYDSLAALRLLDGLVDIYMPDMKYSDNSTAYKYSKIKRYATVNRAAVKEMHRQVGDLQIDENGLTHRGLLVRHLVLPNELAGTRGVVQFLSEEISKKTYLNLMDQYRPVFHADNFPELDRGVSSAEYEAAVGLAKRAGMTRLDQRDRFRWIF